MILDLLLIVFIFVLNEGYSMSDLEAYQKALNKLEGFIIGWYATLEPKFEPADPKPDFVWVDIWRSNSLLKEKLSQNKYNNS